MEANILIVDDDINVRNSLRDFFENEGFNVSVAVDGDQALVCLENSLPDLIILDVRLPFVDGLEVCKTIRQKYGQTISIIMISGSKKDTVDKVVGLELGADVYLTKPIATVELLAQARALLRRAASIAQQQRSGGWLIIDEHLKINFDMRKVAVEGKEIHLTPTEYDLLKLLVNHPGKAFSRSDLVDLVWGYQAGGDISDGAVNTTVTRLRKAIEPDLANPRYILSIHGVGYRFKEL